MLIATFIALFFIALFAGAEIAFISANKLRVELKRERGSKRGEILARFHEKPEDFISAMLVGLNIALVVVTFFLTKLLTPYIEPFIHEEVLMLFVITIVNTVIILIIGEFIPKIIFKLFADEILYNLAFPLKWLLNLLQPITWVMTRLATGFLGLFFKTQEEHHDEAFSRLDLENFIKTTRTESEEEIDTQLFGKALYLKQVKVKACMVPRMEIIAINIDSSVEELLSLFRETKLSKILITQKENLDEIIGYVHHHQMLKKTTNIRDIVMDIPIVHESMRADKLMNFLIKEQTSIACVVDEFGSTSGVVTMEDIFEQIFGDIDDEHDQEDYVEQQISNTEFIFSGRLEIDYLNDKYQDFLHFPTGDYHTLSGYIIMTTATIPDQGTEIELDGYKFVLELVGDKKIETIRVLRLNPE